MQSRRSRSLRAWALRANFGNGNIDCGLEIDHDLRSRADLVAVMGSREDFKADAPASFQALPILPEFLKRFPASAHLAECLAPAGNAANISPLR